MWRRLIPVLILPASWGLTAPAMAQPDLSGWNQLVRPLEYAPWAKDFEMIEPGSILGTHSPQLNPARFRSRSNWGNKLIAQLEALPLSEHHADRALQVLLADGMRAFTLVQSAADRHRGALEDAFSSAGLPPDWVVLPMALTGWNNAYYGPGRRAGPWAMDLATSLACGLEIRRGWDERHIHERMTAAAIAHAGKATQAFPDDPLKQVLAFIRGRQAADRFNPEAMDAELLEWLHLLRVLLQTDQNFDRDDTHSLWLLREKQQQSITCTDGDILYFSFIDAPTGVQRAMKQENPWFTTDSVAFLPERPGLVVPLHVATSLNAPLPCGQQPERNPPIHIIRHQVQPGEVLGVIARNYGVRIEAITAHNGLDSDLIRVGQWLEIPGGTTPATSSKASSTAPASRVEKAPSGSWIWHTVVEGESYWSISNLYPQASLEDLLRINETPPESLRPGMKIRIPSR